jgi:hypothetical protein
MQSSVGQMLSGCGRLGLRFWPSILPRRSRFWKAPRWMHCPYLCGPADYRPGSRCYCNGFDAAGSAFAIQNRLAHGKRRPSGLRLPFQAWLYMKDRQRGTSVGPVPAICWYLRSTTYYWITPRQPIPAASAHMWSIRRSVGRCDRHHRISQSRCYYSGM